MKTEIRNTVFRQLRLGVVDVRQLLAELPGLYPGNLLRVLESLQNHRQVGSFAGAAIRQMKERQDGGRVLVGRLPLPHPLDYEWRFAAETVESLVTQLARQKRAPSNLVLLSVPSLLPQASVNAAFGRVTLIEANEAMIRHLRSRQTAKTAIVRCDILAETPPPLAADLVVTDPPWYPHYYRAFLWAAARVSRVGGLIFVCFPPRYTRPGMARELRHIRAWAEKNGLVNIVEYRSALKFETPFFEKNSLAIEGISLRLDDWRAADLLVFKKVRSTAIPQPRCDDERPWAAWKEIKSGPVRIKVRPSGVTRFQDPRLISIVPYDVLPSVSRRDPRRRLADIWTSGNRVFRCEGPLLFAGILEARTKNRNAVLSVARLIGRELSKSERAQVLLAVRQADRLLRLEKLPFNGETT